MLQHIYANVLSGVVYCAGCVLFWEGTVLKAWAVPELLAWADHALWMQA